MILFNRPIGATRLWFLYALIYVYAIYWCMVAHKVSENSRFCLGVVCLGLNIILNELTLFGIIYVPDYFTRNFLLMGFPFFVIGEFLKKNEERIFLISEKVILLSMIICVSLTIISVYNDEMYFSQWSYIFITILAFVYSMRKVDTYYSPRLVSLFECSLGIYIFHRPIQVVASLILKIFEVDRNEMIFVNYMPIIVCFLSTVCTLIAKMLNVKCR